MPFEPTFLPCGDTALSVEFGSEIDAAVSTQVLALDRQVMHWPEVVETVPTYRSLLIHYDPVAIGFAALRDRISGLPPAADEAAAEGRHWRIPVVYGGAFGVDLDDVASRHGLTAAQLIERHAAPTYRVYMIGFQPGFAYLGGLDPSLATPRRDNPRLVTPAGSVSIGGIQAAVASIEAPSGWHLLGRTPVRSFQLGRDPVFLLSPGDRVSFDPIDPSDWEALDRAAAAGEPVAEPVA